MKTKQVPIIITLIAGLAICIIGFLTRMETKQFVKTWVIVLIIFYILGCVAKLLLDKNFKEELDEVFHPVPLSKRFPYRIRDPHPQCPVFSLVHLMGNKGSRPFKILPVVTINLRWNPAK